MAYNLEPRTIKENLLGLIGKNPHAEPRPANTREECFLADIAENGGGLPEVTAADNGDVLAVVDGEWSKAPAPSSLPPYTSADKGKVLTVGEKTTTISLIAEQTIVFNNEAASATVTADPVLANAPDEISYYFDDGHGAFEGVASKSENNTYNLVDTGISLKIDRDGYWVALRDWTEGEYSCTISASTEYIDHRSVEPKWEAASLIINPQGEVQYNENNGWLVGVDKTFSDVLSCYDATNPSRMIKPIFIQVGTFSDTAPYYDYENEDPRLFVLPAIGGGSISYEVGSGYWHYGLIFLNNNFYISASYTAK